MCYALQTVTYGTTSAPYLAIRVLQQVAKDEEEAAAEEERLWEELDEEDPPPPRCTRIRVIFPQIRSYLTMRGANLKPVALQGHHHSAKGSEA